jgi:hypothetical protein
MDENKTETASDAFEVKQKPPMDPHGLTVLREFVNTHGIVNVFEGLRTVVVEADLDCSTSRVRGVLRAAKHYVRHSSLMLELKQVF